MLNARLLLVPSLLLAGLVNANAATKPCAELEAEIAAKLDAKGIKGYELMTVDKKDVPQAGGAQVVGSCEGGSKQITYSKKP